MKSFLIVMQQDPYVNSLALEGLEFALALSAFNQPVSLLFKGAAVIQLLKQQEPDKLVAKDFTRIYSGLNLFGIENVFVDQNSLQEYAAGDLSLAPQILDPEGISALIKKHDVVITI